MFAVTTNYELHFWFKHVPGHLENMQYGNEVGTFVIPPWYSLLVSHTCTGQLEIITTLLNMHESGSQSGELLFVFNDAQKSHSLKLLKTRFVKSNDMDSSQRA